MKIKSIYFLTFLSQIIFSSCLPVYERNDYVKDDTKSKWNTYSSYSDEQTEHIYYFSNSNRTIAKTKRLFDVSHLCFEWYEKGHPVYTTFLFIPIFPNFLFNSSDHKDQLYVNLYMLSKNDSIIINLNKVKLIVNDSNVLIPNETRETFFYIGADGFKTSVSTVTFDNNNNNKIFKRGSKDSSLERSEFEKIRYFSDVINNYTFNVNSDTIKTLTILFDSVEVKGKKVYVEPLHLKQRTYWYYDYSMFK